MANMAVVTVIAPGVRSIMGRDAARLNGRFLGLFVRYRTLHNGGVDQENEESSADQF